MMNVLLLMPKGCEDAVFDELHEWRVRGARQWKAENAIADIELRKPRTVFRDRSSSWRAFQSAT